MLFHYKSTKINTETENLPQPAKSRSSLRTSFVACTSFAGFPHNPPHCCFILSHFLLSPIALWHSAILNKDYASIEDYHLRWTQSQAMLQSNKMRQDKNNAKLL
jgi:hypothetical protein